MSKEEIASAASSDYYRGFHDGYQAAQKDSTRIIPTQPITRTEDLMWPDRLPTTYPFPPTMKTNRCGTCGIEMKGAWSYVCNHPNCPTKVTCTYATSTGINVNTLADNNMSAIFPEMIQPITSIKDNK